ncbi:peptidase inhibitor family I36 protein [Streptomyces apocyni]|uniref:peptidase inhibitor family I36 protein n=1 Tax=Streptomyces apocyni TaxID=2654677 RepID=UPI0012EA4C44|nr:peptidase inhibitor family I36 protein [Streptomyces apocyni]
MYSHSTTTRTVTRSTLRTAALGTALAAAVLTAAPAAGAATPTPTPTSTAALGACGPGELCLWERPDFGGDRQVHELAGTDIESCVALPEGSSAQALANRTGRPVTTYQSAVCAETGEFETYPGSGTWVPKAPYRVRAFKIWEY